MKKVNDSVNHPLQFIANDGRIFGQFYQSNDRSYHLAEYVPYTGPPHECLCGMDASWPKNLPGSREDYPERNKCKACFDKLAELERSES